MTLEVILSTAFGVQADIQNDKESLLLERTKEVFRAPWIVNILKQFPPIGGYMLKFMSRVRRREGYFDKVASVAPEGLFCKPKYRAIFCFIHFFALRISSSVSSFLYLP